MKLRGGARMDEQCSSLKSELKFLERLSIEELEALLKLSGNPDDVELLFDTVVEEVVAREEKNPTGRLPDVDTAWDEFQMMYRNMPDEGTLPPLVSEGEAASISAGVNGSAPLAEPTADKPRRISLRRAARTAAVMAAAVVLCLGLMVGAQAAGVDVFGVLARWTDDTFHFETWSAEPTYCEALHDTIQEVFDTQGILGEFVPTWYPDGYNVASVKTSEDALGQSIDITLLNESLNAFSIRLDRYNQNTYIDSQTFEIEAQSVEKYKSNGRNFFILINDDSVVASWSDGITVYTIWGELDEESIKLIIDSIGG